MEEGGGRSVPMPPHFLIVLDLGGWVLLVDPHRPRLLQLVGASEDTVMVASESHLPAFSCSCRLGLH